MMKKRTHIAIAVLISMLLLSLIVCFATAAYVYQTTVHAVNPDRRPLAVKKAGLESRGFDVDAMESRYQVRSIEIKSSFDGHLIPANYLTVDGSQERNTVILAHGLNGNRLTGYPVAAMFLAQGYNVLSYDQRDSGENKAPFMTCGYWESKDFQDCVQYVRSKVGAEYKVGGWGSSIGGATIGFYLKTDHADKYLDFAILDCPVSDTKRIVSGFLLRGKLPFLPQKFKLAMGDLANRMKLGFSYEEADVRKAIQETKVPVLIINSKKDGVTPYYMGKELYQSMRKNKKQIWTVNDSGHTDIYWDYPVLYSKTMFAFIKDNV